MLPSQVSSREYACLNGNTDSCYQHLGFKMGMALASLNINGLRSHFLEVQQLIRSQGIHLLALNETKLDPNYPKDLTNIPGYQQERRDRARNGGGVSIYVRDTIKYKLRSEVPTDDLEIICIGINPSKGKSFLILAWYRPPNDAFSSFHKLEMFRKLTFYST